MDVLHFMKEEYSELKAKSFGLSPGDMVESLEGSALTDFMIHLELLIRVGGDLIIPELMDVAKGSISAAIVAEEQSRGLIRVINTFKKAGTLIEGKRRDVFLKVFEHVEQMEKIVLPLVREVIPTAIREEIGEIAADYKLETRGMLSRVVVGDVGHIISA